MTLIDIDPLKERIDEEVKEGKVLDGWAFFFKTYLDDAPVIDAVSMVKGTWKISKHNGDLQRYAVCDKCGYQYGAGIFNGLDCIGIKYYNFCPYCGADMRKGADDE